MSYPDLTICDPSGFVAEGLLKNLRSLVEAENERICYGLSDSPKEILIKLPRFSSSIKSGILSVKMRPPPNSSEELTEAGKMLSRISKMCQKSGKDVSCSECTLTDFPIDQSYIETSPEENKPVLVCNCSIPELLSEEPMYCNRKSTLSFVTPSCRDIPTKGNESVSNIDSCIFEDQEYFNDINDDQNVISYHD